MEGGGLECVLVWLITSRREEVLQVPVKDVCVVGAG